MSFSGLIAVLALAAAALFAVLNQPLLLESRAVAVPGGTYSVPLVGILLGGAAAVIVLMVLGEAGAAASWRTSRAKLSRRIYDRDREVLDLKTGTHAGMERRIEEIHSELSERIDALARLIEARLPVHTTARETLREEPDHATVHRETTVTHRR